MTSQNGFTDLRPSCCQEEKEKEVVEEVEVGIESLYMTDPQPEDRKKDIPPEISDHPPETSNNLGGGSDNPTIPRW